MAFEKTKEDPTETTALTMAMSAAKVLEEELTEAERYVE